MQKIIPNIWCDRNAEQAGEFYVSAFENAHSEIESRYPEAGLLEFQREFAGAPLTVGLTISGTRFRLINAGDEFHPNPSISFMLNFDPLLFDGSEEQARASLDRLWGRLSDGGSALMPLDAYPFSARYGWVQDRYGVNWQLMLTDPAGDPRPFISPALMFDGASQDRAAEAADFYVSLFSDLPSGSAVGNRFPYGMPSGDAGAGALAFGEFRLGEQWFVGNDNGSGVDHGFSCGVSLEVDCADQAEIDRLWAALSSVPEAEACGWCADRFGVCWQIVPADLGELMRRPNAYEHLMGMKKIVIAEL
ncbi:MAG: VOC family protein [Actinobacteria bacterium]|nr:VOC family protein [Actinomycetota bacterium]